MTYYDTYTPALDDSLACLDPSFNIEGRGLEQRLAEIIQITDSQLHDEAIAALKFTDSNYDTAAELRREFADECDMRYLASGAMNTVYAFDEVAVKTVRLGRFRPTDEQAAIAQYLTIQREYAKCFLDQFMVDHVYTSGPDPLFGEPNVYSVQKLCEFDPAESLTPQPGTTLTLEEFIGLEAKYPGLADDLFKFTNSALTLLDSYKLVTDVFGKHNLVVGRPDKHDTPRLCLLDDIPNTYSVEGHENTVNELFAMMELACELR